MIVHGCIFLYFVSTSVLSKSYNYGIIIPPNKNIKSHTDAMYDPSGKHSAPTSLPSGVKMPESNIYGPGKVQTPSKTETTPQTSSSSNNNNNNNQKPSRVTNSQVSSFVNYLLGTNIKNPLGVDIDKLPSNADINIKVVQPIYASKTTSSNGIYGSYSNQNNIPMGSLFPSSNRPIVTSYVYQNRPSSTYSVQKLNRPYIVQSQSSLNRPYYNQHGGGTTGFPLFNYGTDILKSVINNSDEGNNTNDDNNQMTVPDSQVESTSVNNNYNDDGDSARLII